MRWESNQIGGKWVESNQKRWVKSRQKRWVESSRRQRVKSSQKLWPDRNCRCQWRHSYRKADTSMGGLLTQRWRAHGEHDDWWEANVIDILVEVVNVSLCTGRIICNRSMVRFPGGVIFSQVGWQVRLFKPSDLLDIPSERLSVQTIPMSMYMNMDRRSCYMGGGGLHQGNIFCHVPFLSPHLRSGLAPIPVKNKIKLRSQVFTEELYSNMGLWAIKTSKTEGWEWKFGF